MSRQLSKRSATRVNSELPNSSATSNHCRLMPTIFKNSRSAKKQLSLKLNTADFELCQAPNESEMLEIVSNSHEGSSNTNPLGSTNEKTIIDEQQPSSSLCHHGPISNGRDSIIKQIKKIIVPNLCESSRKHEGNEFLIVNRVGSELVVIPNDNIDQLNTRHPELCEYGPMDEDDVDINQVQLIPTTPVTPSLLPPPPPPPQQSQSCSSLLPNINHANSHHEPDINATQAGVECAAPSYDESNLQDTQISATNSASSTNSSNNEPMLTDIDRSTLNDTDYILAQKQGLERITIFEISLNEERRDYLQSLSMNESDELDFNDNYKEAIQKNLRLKEELKTVEEQNERTNLAWACEICTYINEPYIRTRKDVCDMCEGPSPLKRHTLTH